MGSILSHSACPGVTTGSARRSRTCPTRSRTPRTNSPSCDSLTTRSSSAVIWTFTRSIYRQSKIASSTERLPRHRRTANRIVLEPQPPHLIDVVDITPIEDHRLLEKFANALKIRRAKLVPFRADGQAVRALQRVICIAAARHRRAELPLDVWQ